MLQDINYVTRIKEVLPAFELPVLARQLEEIDPEQFMQRRYFPYVVVPVGDVEGAATLGQGLKIWRTESRLTIPNRTHRVQITQWPLLNKQLAYYVKYMRGALYTETSK